MRVTERMKKWISILMCLCMLVQNAPVMAFAATTDNLCDHHPKHTEDCGYVEAVAGSACTHEHSEACYEIVECKHTCSDECGDPCTTHTCTVDDGCITRSKDCHHVHGECGYAEAVEPQDCTTCQPVLVHAQNCGYVESADEVTCACEPTVTHGGEGCTYVEGKDGSPCTHVCAVVVDSDDSCYKLLCSHKDGGHDDACGYAAAVEGHECHYECSACEDNAGDDSPVPEGVCAHGNSEENCETCVAEIQVMINALPDMEDIGDHNRANVISQLEAIDDRMWKLSDAAKGKLNADKYVDAAFVLSAPEDFFGFVLTKRYEAGASAMPQASFAFLDASGVAATVITPEEQQTTSVEPVSNGGAVRGYLPVGEYTLDETVVGDWNLTMSVNGQADDDHTFTGEGGRAYRIETINTKPILIQLTPSENGSVEVETNDNVWNENGNYLVAPGKTVTLTVTPASGYELDALEVKPESADKAIVPTGEDNTYTFVAPDYNVTVTATFKPLCEHTTEEKEENKATCKKQAVCDLCGESYGEVNKNNHDETMPSEEYDNGFCSYCDAYQSATQNAEGYYEISNAGQLYWFAEQVNFKNPSINGKLMEDILVNENVLNSDGTVSSGPFRQWYSIGSTEYGVEFKYSGTFNGNGKTISGLYFNYNDKDGVGLFGYVDSGEIQNVGIKDSYFNGGDNVGSVVAHNHKGTVTGCYNTGTVSGANNVGGVVGKNDEGTVTDCYNSGLIGSRVNNVGGVLGGNIGTVSDCYNTGSISGQNCVGGVAGYSNGSATDCYNTGKVDGNEMVGGVLGLNESGSTLSNCYNTGEVNGQFWVGGVLGLNHVGSTLINCYNTGEVGDGFYIGGVLGLNERESTLINCYNTGKVSGGLSDGGVAGKNVQGTIDYCYYLTGSATRGIGEGNGTTEDKKAEAFASGEVAALLGVPFGQNIDNDQTKQEIPCFSNAIVYAVQNCNSDMVYSNTDEDIGHKWENGKCSICEALCSHSGSQHTTGTPKDEGTHSYTCSICNAEATENHSFNSDTGKCSACGAREIFFEANVSWNKVYVYYFDDKNQSLVTWPGVELTKNDEDLRYRLVVPKDAAGIIFNDGNNDSKNKTDDLTLGVENCYHYDGNNRYWYTYPCTEHTWGKDGKCSNCRTACPHNSFNSTTGLCTDCKTDIAVASVKIGGTTTKFKTLDDAVDAAEAGTAEAPATLTLLKDINLGESDQQIDSGVFTLDLNGCELAGVGSRVLNISRTPNSKPDVTITDSKEGGTISGGKYGVNVYGSTVTIKDGIITATEFGVYADNSNVEISGTITATKYGVYASNSNVKISGTITATKYGVYASVSTVEISDGTISSTENGVYAFLGTVEISGGTITATDYGVLARISTVTISGAEITGVDGGVYAEVSSEVEISDGTISSTGNGVYAKNSNVKISGGTITGSDHGVFPDESSTVTITGGEISGEYGVYGIHGATVTITGGTITGGSYDLRVVDGGSIILGLGEDDIGATFPGGLTVSNTTLVDILANGAAYWQGTKMLTNIADDAITITGGDVTVKAVCKHENVTYSGDSNNATEHKVVCSCGYVVATESHTRTYTASGNVITASCSKCKVTLGTATITANGKTYNGEAVTAAVQTTGVLTGSNIGITYSQNGEELNESAIRAGTYTASIKLGDAVAKVNFTITPATLPNAVLSETGYTYNGQQQKPAVTVTGLTENTDYTVTYPQDVTNAGEKTVTITGKGNYTGTVKKSYTIAKADSAVTKAPQAAANLVYNGKNQNLVIAGTVTGGTLQYSLDGKTWAAKIPVGKAAGTYTVSYKVVGDANHKDIAVRTLAVTIAKGTAPAVDALVQTHFYAYATANTVDLAKYLPADRGTTAYTAIGVSADIFSSVLSVTNAGVLSYTTRKLTAAPASDTQISIKVVMENYADAELTVIVKLLAVTEQTQQKIVKAELTEVPDGLAGTRFHSVDAIKTEQKRVLGLQLGYDPQGNILHYDVKLQFSPDGGKTWVNATEENFPANGLTVTLPYPSGTGKDTHNFVVSHMFATGAKAGTTETPAVTKTADGIRFTVTGLSPVSVACSAIPFDVKVDNVTNGTVYVSPAHTAAGTQVTITATPKSGYRLSSLAVKDAAGNSYTVSTDNNDKYYFIMPAADVTVTATFTAKSTAVADTTNPKTGDDFPILFWSGMMMTTLLGAAALMLNKQKFYER